MCFGGTMVWSIDFQEEDSPVFDPGDSSPGTIGGSIPNDGSSTGNGKALYNTPFAGFLGCDTENQVPAIQKAWDDVVDLIQIPMTLNFERGISDWCEGLCEPGIIEQRIWGRELDSERRFEEYERIRNVFTNIGRLDTGAEKKGNNHIRISCKDEYLPSVPEKDRPACEKIITEKTIGGYALSSSTTYKDNTIVLCPNFFISNKLYEINRHFADGSWDGKDPGYMKNRAAIFLHELAHLAAIAGNYPTDIIDQRVYWTPDQTEVERIYDIKLVEKLAVREPDLTSKNGELAPSDVRRLSSTNDGCIADNYAWYATEKFFEDIYGISKVVYTGKDDDPPAVTPTKALNIIRKCFFDPKNYLRGLLGDSRLS
ncbi:hypothetical protein PVAG01_08992 [Phlyctema vagabunda]|uniref:Lysine-specific metallo-endopeptidase domain-containing protein n=1 Tax=Phlyctema vagabunda TaxID=108571 RepID=A0ABR4P642_9HELO